jgi:hypothetical protein
MIEIGSILLMLLALHALMVNILKTKLTPVHNVTPVIIIGLMLLMENAEIAQMIPFSRNQITLVSLVLMATNILLIELKLDQELAKQVDRSSKMRLTMITGFTHQLLTQH